MTLDLIYLTERELFRRKYSPRTIKTYSECLRNFLKFCRKEPRKITKKDAKDYLEKLSEENKSGSTINISLQSIKFAMENVLNKRFFVKVHYSKTPKKLPEFLTKGEVWNLFGAITNTKHALMVKLMYSAGLRVSELLNLRVRDFQFDKNYGWVRQGKGGKDRLFIIAESLRGELINHIKSNSLCDDSSLFQGRNRNTLSQRTVQEIIKMAAKRAKIKKHIHPHTLRHSFATHLIENGYDVTTVQSLLGHRSAQTTMVYVHMASPNLINVKSPIDK